MLPRLRGLHHVTAIADDPQRNVDFYAGVLGLRLVKVTVNVDDPEAYHLYYGGEVGRPGTLLTFYCWPGAIRGRPGTGQIIVTALAVPPGTLDAWRSRLSRHGVQIEEPPPRDGGQVLPFRDPDGLALELVAHPDVRRWPAPTRGPLPARQAIRALSGVTIWVERRAPTEAFLTTVLGARSDHEDPAGDVRHYRFGHGGPGTRVDVREIASAGRGLIAVGSVHHVGLRVPNEAALSRWQEHLSAQGSVASETRDRVYYRAITLKEPGGVRIELATDRPSVTIDEQPAELGARLALPPWLEGRRPQLTHTLPELRLPGVTPDNTLP
jgi:glyoxalase family protein